MQKKYVNARERLPDGMNNTVNCQRREIYHLPSETFNMMNSQPNNINYFACAHLNNGVKFNIQRKRI